MFWNKCDITNLFRENQRSDVVEITWQTRIGDVLKIVAHSTAVPGVEHQYDLRVNGTSFFEFPLVADIGSPNTDDIDNRSTTSSLTMSNAGSAILNSSIDRPPEAMDYRLSMVGLNNSDSNVGDVVDELHSEVFSSALDTVRYHIVACLPQVESLVSRAIMDAFISEKDGYSSSSSSSESDRPFETDISKVELHALWEAFEWTRSNAHNDDAKDEMLEVMQKHVTATFRRIRHGEMPAHIATRLLLNVAALLGLEFASPIPKDTVIVFGLAPGTTTEDLRRVLSSFGYVESAAAFKFKTGFGFCRFLDENSPQLVCNAFRKGDLRINGSKAKAFVLSETTGRELWMHLLNADDESRQDSGSFRFHDDLTLSSGDRTNSESSHTKTKITHEEQSLSPTSVMMPVFPTPQKIPEKMFAHLVDDRCDLAEVEGCPSFESVKA